MQVEIFVLNYNGRHLLAECLPSVVQAAEASRHPCRVTVVDNTSTDDSLALLAADFPQVRVLTLPNRGLCSFNSALGGSEADIALLLNNDIKLDAGCVDALVEPLLPGADARCFMTAPRCYLFDGRTYEGLKTAVRWRWGLVQATALYEGHESTIHRGGLTASAGAVLAVPREKFLRLGGFDPQYLPGRLEDVDFAYRGFQAGWHARYVPGAVAYHRGAASFAPALGAAGCDALALRNTLLFQWKNLRHPVHVARQALGLPLRIAYDVVRAPFSEPQRRWAFCRALAAAIKRRGQLRDRGCESQRDRRREWEFFRRFHPRAMADRPTRRRQPVEAIRPQPVESLG